MNYLLAAFFLLLGCPLRAQGFPIETVICTEGSFVLDAPLTEPQGAYLWERSFDGGGNWQLTGGDADSLLIPDPTNGVSYRLTYAADAVCLEDPMCWQRTGPTTLRIRVPRFSQGVRLCAGDTLFVGDQVLTTAGNHRTVLSTSGGCDSILETFIEVLPTFNQLYFVDLCAGDYFRGEPMSSDTLIAEIYTTGSGCDSVVRYEITVGGGLPQTLSGPDRICAGTSAELSVPGQFESYAWSIGSSDRNITVTEAGNYSLTVTNASGCSTVLSHEVTITDVFIEEIDVAPPACPGSASGQLAVRASGDEGLLYGISEILQVDSVFTGLSAGSYSITVETAEGCQATEVATVPAAAPLQLHSAHASALRIERGDSILFDLAADFAVQSWAWSPPQSLSCSDCPDPIARPGYSLTYRVTATAAGDCNVTESFAIEVLDHRRYYAPTAFRPGGQEANDRWRLLTGPSTTGISDLRISDRWGGIHYQVTDTLPPDHEGLAWEGTDAGAPLPAGTYFFTARLHFTDGTVEQVSGPITLVR